MQNSREFKDSSLGSDTRHENTSKIHDYINNINDNRDLKTNFSQSNTSSTKNFNRTLNIGLTNTNFVYNNTSCPTRLRKKVREKFEFSPEVLAILLRGVKYNNKNKNKNKNSNKLKTLRGLLEFGRLDKQDSSASR